MLSALVAQVLNKKERCDESGWAVVAKRDLSAKPSGRERR